MSDSHSEISKPKLLIGEGKDELNFFSALVRHLEITDVQIEDYQGKTKLSSYIKTLPTRPNFNNLTSIGITADADENAVQTFQSVTAGLRRARLPSPARVGEFVESTPKVGVFVLPDGKNGGMLEDLCLMALEATPEITCVDDFLRCVRELTTRQPRILSKARLSAWLSTMPEPARRLGEAAESGSFSWSSPAFADLVEFIRRL